ncbi:hypothetical protein [Microcoleus sp. PH2017_05_CCC_O_A]|uniref:hypothetical protein n=1 Tax=Microcoleus sp. PH2017_05_CCC_O_A TaxID=2798816 RepID=UPI0025CF0CC5|nr:hypothetical protein [Microcoleus sp. PH2017_05_CCC_O_A]
MRHSRANVERLWGLTFPSIPARLPAATTIRCTCAGLRCPLCLLKQNTGSSDPAVPRSSSTNFQVSALKITYLTLKRWLRHQLNSHAAKALQY